MLYKKMFYCWKSVELKEKKINFQKCKLNTEQKQIKNHTLLM